MRSSLVLSHSFTLRLLNVCLTVSMIVIMQSAKTNPRQALVIPISLQPASTTAEELQCRNESNVALAEGLRDDVIIIYICLEPRRESNYFFLDSGAAEFDSCLRLHSILHAWLRSFAAPCKHKDGYTNALERLLSVEQEAKLVGSLRCVSADCTSMTYQGPRTATSLDGWPPR